MVFSWDLKDAAESIGQRLGLSEFQTDGMEDIDIRLRPSIVTPLVVVASRICQTLLSPSVQAIHVPDYVPPRRRTFHCHGCARSSANVHLATTVNLRGTTCLKICAPLQTQQSSDSS